MEDEMAHFFQKLYGEDAFRAAIPAQPPITQFCIPWGCAGAIPHEGSSATSCSCCCCVAVTNNLRKTSKDCGCRS